MWKLDAYPTNFTYRTNHLLVSSAWAKNTRSRASAHAVVACTGNFEFLTLLACYTLPEWQSHLHCGRSRQLYFNYYWYLISEGILRELDSRTSEFNVALVPVCNGQVCTVSVVLMCVLWRRLATATLSLERKEGDGRPSVVNSWHATLRPFFFSFFSFL